MKEPVLETKELVAKLLLKVRAVTLNPQKPFRYDSGILSPVYTDCRIFISYPEHRKVIRDLYIEAMNKTGEKFDVIAGTATAGIPHAAWIADKLDLPMVYVRKAAKDNGKGNQIEGLIKKGQNAAVIEDLISTSGSSAVTANTVREAGGKVSYIFSIITYGMKKAKENLKENKLKLVSLTTFQDVVNVAQKLDFIKQEEAKIVLNWATNPVTWGKRMGFE